MGKRCANLNSLRALERVLKNLGRWKNINFLKSSPRQAEGQIFEETPCKPTSVCFTILTALLVPTGSACHVWGQLVLYLFENWQNKLHKKLRKKANSTKSCGIAWTPYSKSGAKLLPTIVTSASLSYCCRKTSVSALCSSPESGLTREKQYILEHSDTERLYCVETSPSHLSANQLLLPCTSIYLGLCGWFRSRSCVSSVSASLWSFFQVKLKNPKNIWKTSDLWLDPNTPILDSFFRSVHQSWNVVYVSAHCDPWNLFRRFSDVHIHCVS